MADFKKNSNEDVRNTGFTYDQLKRMDCTPLSQNRLMDPMTNEVYELMPNQEKVPKGTRIYKRID